MKNGVFVVGIAGGSSSGKTSFLREVLSHFTPEEVALVSQDNYYFPREQQQRDLQGVVNYDLPTSIDRQNFYRDMCLLASGQSIEKLEYNFNNPAWKPRKVVVHSAPVIIMEGLFIFHYEEICGRCDYKVYIDVQQEERLRRRIYRDARERGYPEHEVRYQWENHVRPAEQMYLEPFIKDCDLVVDNSVHFREGLDELVARINEHLATNLH